MQLAWGPAIDTPSPDGKARQYGNALLSRLPILISDVHHLPGGGEPRSALGTMVELDGGTLWVTATHLSGGNPERRAAQVATVADLHTEGMETGVIVGDFNAEPEAPEFDALRQRFTDAWQLARARDNQAGWRFWRGDEGDTFPARAPRKRIDHVWVSEGVAVAGARVGDGEGASDHLPLVVDLEVRSGV
jgi:endonuclease/exonuclease/phosphatase family metal-dependent hydrolase